MVIFISYFLTQRRNDKRKYIDTVQVVIQRIFEILKSEKLHTITTKDDVNFVRITQKRIDNELKVLQENIDSAECLEKVNYIKTQFDAYWNLVSNHIDDVTHLANSNRDLLNYITNMEGKLSELMFDIQKLKKNKYKK